MDATTRRTARFGLLAALAVALAGPALAQWNAEAFRLYGGTYSADCANPAALKLRVDADALVIDNHGRTMTARQLEPSFSYFGQQSPPQFQVAIMSQLKGVEVVFLVYRDKRGRYVDLQADARLMAALGLRPNDTTHYRDCDAGRRQSDGAAAAGEARANARAERQAAAASPLADREFKRAYHGALGPKVRESWLATLDGPALDQKTVRVAGTEYVQIAFCKAHDCHDNNVLLLYSRASGTVYGVVFEAGRRRTLIGQPPAAVAAELDRLWRAEWRQNR
jgi:hypothetical protein